MKSTSGGRKKAAGRTARRKAARRAARKTDARARAEGWSRLSVQSGGTGLVAHAGVVLPRLLGDRVGLSAGLSRALDRAGFLPGRDRGRALVDAVAAMACGAAGLTDIEAMTSQEELCGPGGGASDSTLLRILDEYGERLGQDGLPGERLAGEMAAARATAWAAIVDRHGTLPAVRVAGNDLTRAHVAADGTVRYTQITVLRIDATLIEADSAKENAAANYKGGFGFHPMASACSNVGDYLATMNWPGNAGSFTAADLTGLLREGPGGDRLDTWPSDMRILARCVQRAPGEQAPLGEDATWRHSAFATNTAGGQVQFLDARHRTQAHIEDNNKDLKACGGANLHSKDYRRNSAWLQLAALAVTLLAWLRHTALDGDVAKASPKTLRYRLLAVPARLVAHARRRVLKVAGTWPWARDLTTAWDRLQALHPA